MMGAVASDGRILGLLKAPLTTERPYAEGVSTLLYRDQKAPSKSRKGPFHLRADEGNRTPDLLFTRQMLCRLSYVGAAYQCRR